MIYLEDIKQGFRGVIAMADGKSTDSSDANNWRNILDASLEGIYRSFWAVPLSIPLMLIQFFAGQKLIRTMPDEQLAALKGYPAPFIISLEVISFIVVWAVSLLFLGHVCRATQKTGNAAWLITGYNWSRLLLWCLNGAIAAIILVVPRPEMLAIAMIGVAFFGIYLTWGVIKQSLDFDTGPVIGMIVALFLINILLEASFFAIGTGLYEIMGGEISSAIDAEQIE